MFKSFVKLLTKVTNWEALKTISSTTQISHESWSSLKSLENIAGVANADDFFALFNCTYAIVSWCTGNQRMICMHWFNCTSMYDLSFPVSPRAHLRCSGGWEWFNCRADRLLMTKLAQLSRLFHKMRGVLLFVDCIDPDQNRKKLTYEEFHWGFAEQYRVAELHKALLDAHVLPNEIIYN